MMRRPRLIPHLVQPLAVAALVLVAACERNAEGILYIADMNGPEHAVTPARLHPLFVHSQDGQLTVRLPECGDFSMGTSYNFRNTVHPNWGCASQRNLAVMVANPADLAGAAAFDNRDSTRTAKVVREYRDGKATKSEYGSLSVAPRDRGGF